MAAPIPIAVRLESGITLRGHEWSVDGMAIVFVHGFGEDLDVWGTVPSRLAAAGFRVISLELRGHGLSDGEPDRDSVRDDIRELSAEVAGSFGPVALVTHGETAETVLHLGPDAGVPVHILVSPAPLDGDGVDWSSSNPATQRFVMVGALDKEALEYAESIYPSIRGVSMWASTGTPDQGPALLEEHQTMVEQLSIFVRRYLTPFHLAWIAQHADEIKAASDGGGE